MNNPKSLISQYKPYFRYALDLKTINPVIAYYCQLYAINQSLTILRSLSNKSSTQSQNQNTDSNQAMSQSELDKSIQMLRDFLSVKLQELDGLKQKLTNGNNSSEIFNKESMKIQVENFIQAMLISTDQQEQQVLEQISDEDSLEQYKDQLVKVFKDYYKCSHFIQLMQYFNNETEEEQLPTKWQQIQKFCRFKSVYGPQLIIKLDIEKLKIWNPFHNQDSKQELNQKIATFELNQQQEKEQNKMIENNHSIQNLNNQSNNLFHQNREQQQNQIHNSQINANQIVQNNSFPIIKVSQKDKYQAVMNAKKLAKDAVGELDYHNVKNSIQLLQQVVYILEQTIQS